MGVGLSCFGEVVLVDGTVRATGRCVVNSGCGSTVMLTEGERKGSSVRSCVTVLSLLVSTSCLPTVRRGKVFCRRCSRARSGNSCNRGCFSRCLRGRPYSVGMLYSGSLSECGGKGVGSTLGCVSRTLGGCSSCSAVRGPEVNGGRMLVGGVGLLVRSGRCSNTLGYLGRCRGGCKYSGRSSLCGKRVLRGANRGRRTVICLSGSLRGRSALVKFGSGNSTLCRVKRCRRTLGGCGGYVRCRDGISSSLRLLAGFGCGTTFYYIGSNGSTRTIGCLGGAVGVLGKCKELPGSVRAVCRGYSFRGREVVGGKRIGSRRFEGAEFFSTEASVLLLTVVFIFCLVLECLKFGWGVCVGCLIFI